MTTDNKKTNNSFYKILKGLEKLTEEDREILLKSMDINGISKVIESKETIKMYMDESEKYINLCTQLRNVLPKLFDLVNTNTNDETEIIVEEFDKLNEKQKKEVTLKLMNNSAFQKDCCEILAGDFERIVNENPTLKLLNDTLGISKWYRKNIALGIGCDHEYKV